MMKLKKVLSAMIVYLYNGLFSKIPVNFIQAISL
jgi:hypothetical protein